MATKETRATRRQKALETQNARRRARSQRRAFRELDKYRRKIEGVNWSIEQQKSKLWRNIKDLRAAREIATRELDGGDDSGSTGSPVDGSLADDSGGGEEGRLLPDSPEPGRDGAEEGGPGVSSGSLPSAGSTTD